MRAPRLFREPPPLAHLAVACGVFALVWLFRFNDPPGSYAGLTDDHFFYVVRGWQLLFGEWPFRDFVDPGAPLTFVLAAVTQLVGGRGTLSEMVFCVTAIALGTSLTFWIAARAAGSIVAGLGAALFQTAMMARLYNYPKILIYALAVPALWGFASRPGRSRACLVAVITAVAFLMRHDHGVFVALAMAALLVLMTDIPLAARARWALFYGAAVIVLLLPYVAYLHDNGGILLHVRTAMSWSARDRSRAPLIWPAFAAVAADPAAASPTQALAAWAERNYEPWIFYLLTVLPFLAALMLASVRDPIPGVARARPKLLMLAILAVALNLGFLRGALAARFADVSVPQAILAAWVVATAARALRQGSDVTSRFALLRAPATRIVCVVGVLFVVGMTAMVQAIALRGIGVDVSMSRAREVFARYRSTWPLDAWASADTPGPMQLALYFNQCTKPTDHVFVSQYLPQAIALSQRPFAGGHGDLRPDFFNSTEQQQLTIERMSKQAVPVAIVPPAPDYRGFQESFPLLDQYFAQRFRSAGVRDLGDGLTVELLVDKSRMPSGLFERLDWPCFR